MSNDVTFALLQATWSHLTSFPVTWRLPHASYSSVGAQTYPKLLRRLLQPLPGDFCSNDVTSGSLPVMWGHVTSFSVTRRPPPASFSPIGAQTYPKRHTPSTATSRLLPIKWRHFRVNSGHVRSRDVISCHVTNASCELQPCKCSNVPKTELTGLQPLPGNFRWNDVTSGHVMSRDVISCHVMATSCEWQPCRSSKISKSRLIRLL